MGSPLDFTTTSTGNGNLILVENPGSNLVAGDTFLATIATEDINSDEWEVSDCTYIGAGEFSRDAVSDSGANGEYVTFTDGDKTVSISLQAEKEIRNRTNVSITNNTITVANVQANNVYANSVFVGANVISNTTTMLVGNVTINTTSVVVGANVVVNTTSITVPNNGLITASVKSANGYTYVSGGVLLQWGWVATNATSGDITFPIAFPNAIYSQQATANSTDPANTVSIIAATTTTMNVRSTSLAAASNSFWFAVGG